MMTFNDILQSRVLERNVREFNSRSYYYPASQTNEVSLLVKNYQDFYDKKAFDLIKLFIRDEKTVLDKLAHASLITLCQLTLIIEYQVPTVFYLTNGTAREVSREASINGFKQHWLDICKSRLSSNLSDIVKNFRLRDNTNSVNHMLDGKVSNPQMRSHFGLLRGVSAKDGLALATITLQLNQRCQELLEERESPDAIKRSFRRALSNALGEEQKNLAFTFENSSKDNLHIHGLLVFPANKQDKVRGALRHLAHSHSSSLMLQTKYRDNRCPTTKERLLYKQAGELHGSLLIQDEINLTVGAADYAVKELGELISNYNVESKVHIISSRSFPEPRFKEFHNARMRLLRYLVNKLKPDIGLCCSDNFVSELIEQTKGLNAMKNLFAV